MVESGDLGVRSDSAEGRRVAQVGAGHEQWDGRQKALVRIGQVHSVGVVYQQVAHGDLFVHVPVPWVNCPPLEGGVLHVMFPTAFCVSCCSWP